MKKSSKEVEIRRDPLCLRGGCCFKIDRKANRWGNDFYWKCSFLRTVSQRSGHTILGGAPREAPLSGMRQRRGRALGKSLYCAFSRRNGWGRGGRFRIDYRIISGPCRTRAVQSCRASGPGVFGAGPWALWTLDWSVCIWKVPPGGGLLGRWEEGGQGQGLGLHSDACGHVIVSLGIFQKLEPWLIQLSMFKIFHIEYSPSVECL